MIDEKTENRFWSKIETSNHYDECYNVISMQKTKSGHYLFYYKSKYEESLFIEKYNEYENYKKGTRRFF